MPDHLSASREFWNNAAPTFDNEPDHGLRDPVVRSAWKALLKASLRPSQLSVLDVGCGTGSLSLILAEMGYTVTGIDVSPAMIALAEQKAQRAHQAITFRVMDASDPQFPPSAFDFLLCRHLLWTLQTIDQVLQRWAALLKPVGALLLIEGYWSTGAGLPTQQILDALPSSLTNVVVQRLSDQTDLWGGQVADDRYAIRAEHRP